MARKSPSEHVFVLMLPLRCEAWQIDRLDTIFQVGNDIKNHLIAYERKQYENLTSRKDWHAIQKALADAYAAEDVILVKALCERRNEMLSDAGFGKYQFEKQVNKYRKHYRGKGGKGYLIPVHVAQKISASVWDGYQKLLFGNGNQVYFSKWSEFTTITAKTNASGIRYADGFVHFNGMKLKVRFDKKDPYGYQREAMTRDIRYCGIQRRWYASGWHYFVQLTLDGLPPVKVKTETGELLHPMGNGRVGHDIGPQTIASVSNDAVLLTELADKVKGIDVELRRINRALDRSRRATNPEMFAEDGSIVPKDKLPASCLNRRGGRQWVKSKHYLRLESRRRELFRRQREMRVQQHNELVNRLLSFGDEHYIEEMRFRALAKRAKETKTNSKGKFVRKKRFGKSISNKAPALFVKTLERKVISAGGSFKKVDTFSVKASQFNHLTETFTKKNLSKRWNTMQDGTKVQRDLYSAFLIQNVDATLKAVDVNRCNQSYDRFLQLHNQEVQRLSSMITPGSMGIKHIA